MARPLKKLKKPKPKVLDRALDRIYRLHVKESDLGLDRVYRLLADLGNPQDKIAPVFHVAGTNGKGSTLAYLQAIMQVGGYSVHKHTSPHLVRFNERLVINGQEIDDDTLLFLIHHVEKINNKKPITFFEFCMGLNMVAFAQHKADAVLLETGLGGRLDASNVIAHPLATIITPIGWDHMHILGDTLPKIAAEKAGILKPGTPCFVGKQVSDDIYDVFWDKAIAMDAPLYVYGKDWHTNLTNTGFDLHIGGETLSLPLPNLIGAHQVDNAALAIACLYYLKEFNITIDAIKNGIQGAQWPARMQHLTRGTLVSLLPSGCELWLDGGHNKDGVQAIARILAQWQKDGIKSHLVFGTLRNRDPVEIITPLIPYIKTIHTVDFDYPKARSAQETRDVLKKSNIESMPHSGIEEALGHLAQAIKTEDRILICGSLYLAGKVLEANT